MKFIAVIGEERIPIEVNKKDGQYQVVLRDATYVVDAIRPHSQSLSMLVNGVSYEAGFEKRDAHYSVYFYNETIQVEMYEARKFRAAELAKKSVHHGPVKLIAPMPGKVVRILVKEGTEVHEGDPLVVMEAMKMQNELKSPKSGIVKNLQIQEGIAVASQQVLLIIE